MTTADGDKAKLLWAAAILFVLTVIAGTVPVYLIEFLSSRFGKSKNGNQSIRNKTSFCFRFKKIFSKNRIVQFLAQLGAGVLLFTALIHMLPEIRENYEVYLQNQKNSSRESGGEEEESDEEGIPLVDYCALAGFFSIFLIEELMHTLFLSGNHHHHHNDSPQNGHTNVKNTNVTTLARQFSNETIQVSNNGDIPIQVINNDTNNTILQSINTVQLTRYGTYDQAGNFIENYDRLSQCDTENLNNFDGLIQKDRSIIARIFDALLMILAFACHAIFDGISIGVQTGSSIWEVLIAILTHKLLIAFILSVQIHERCFQSANNGGERKPIKWAGVILWFFSILFAALSPIGIFIMLAIGNSTDAPVEQEFSVVILAAISAGTIIYIVFIEIIDKSSSRVHISGLVQWIALILGFGAMWLVTTLFKEA